MPDGLPSAKSKSFRFKVERTSFWDDDEPPCPEAVKGTIPRWDHRTSQSFEAFDRDVGKRTNDLWLSRGTDHALVLGPRGGVQGIKRRLEDQEAWFVEFDDMAGLMAFWKEYGDLIIKVAYEDHETPCIEIYDGYRE